MSIETMTAYTLLNKQEVAELHGTAYTLLHKKTGTRLFLVSNEDDNKVFTIGFRTPPADSTGIAHIIEHSVLCGSEKFPAKDPFVELVKGSLNTFLNAMTYPDKTVYPVASCNDKDFHNLMDVYLDAVFHPNIYRNEKIFRQEGWHYELESADASLCYNGVVYNEMKGALSSPDSLLDDYVAQALYPDTPYSLESGGDPEVIPELTYEQFLDFHRKYYHPSNSYIYLYGNMDLEEKLTFLDEAYLCHYDRLEVDSAIPKQAPFTEPVDMTRYYPVMEGEPLDEAAYLSYNVVAGDCLDPELSMAMQILEYTLLDAPGAPLKQALLDANIGKDIYGGYGSELRQPYFSIVAKEAAPEKKELFLQTVKETLFRLSREGLKKSSLRAAMNYFEFKYREADFGPYPKGLMYGLQCFDSWLYDGDPLLHLTYGRVFASLKKKAEEGYFEELIRTCLLDNPHRAAVTLLPKVGLEAEQDEKRKAKLAAYKESLSAEEIQRIIEETKALKVYQETPDSEETLRTIPMLRREDISPEIVPFSIQEERQDGVTMVHHNLETSGISYLNFLFDMGGLTEEELLYAGLLRQVLGYVDTDRYTYQDLFDVINENSGGMGVLVTAFGKAADPEAYTAKYEVRIKVLEEKTDFAFSIIKEILTASHLDMEKRLYEIIAQLKSRKQMQLTGSSDSAAVLRAASYSSQSGYFNELTGGIAFYRFIEEAEGRYQERKAELMAGLQAVAKRLFSPEKLLISVTSSKAGFDRAREQVKAFAEALSGREDTAPMTTFSLEQKNEGFQYSTGVQYVARYGNFLRKGYSYTGALRILRTILNYEYLWVNIRVMGGAYGCSSGFGRNGAGYFTSYRDPNMKKTNEVFEGIPAYVRDFQASDRDMTKYVIGTISSMDMPMTPQMKGSRSLSAYLSGVNEEMLKKERAQVLSAQAEDIRALAPIVEAVLSEGSICVLGNDRKLSEERDILKEVKPLFGKETV